MMQYERYYCEYMYWLYTGKHNISVENIPFYLWESVQIIKNSSWNYIIVYHLEGHNLVQWLYNWWPSWMFLINKYRNSNTKTIYKAKQCAYFYVWKSHVTMHIFWKYITDGRLKMPFVDIFVKHTLRSLYWNQKNFCKPEQREDKSKNRPMGRMSLAMSWRSGSFQMETVANKK